MADATPDMYRRRKYDHMPPHEISDDEESVLGGRPRSVSIVSGADDTEVDFGSVSLYLPALQTMVALLLASGASILAGALSNFMACNAVRTIAITACVGVGAILRPIRMSYARGVDVMFDSIRPSMLVYIMALVCEQLVHSCRPHPDVVEGSNGFRQWLFRGGVLVMMSAGYWQAIHPQVQTDYPFAVTFSTLVVLTIFAPSPNQGMGPLCDVPSIVNAIERLLRVLTFAWTYITLAYACEPTRHNIGEILLCATRATAGSVWTMCCNRWLLIMGFVQGMVVVFMRVQRNGTGQDINDFVEEHNMLLTSSTPTVLAEDDGRTLPIELTHPPNSTELARAKERILTARTYDVQRS